MQSESDIRARIKLLKDQQAKLAAKGRPSVADSLCNDASAILDRVDKLRRFPPLGQFVWWWGSETENVWKILHAAEEDLNRLEDDLDFLAHRARSHGRENLNGQFVDWVKDRPLANPELDAWQSDRREWCLLTIRDAHLAAVTRFSSERHHTHGVLGVSGFFTLILLALIIWQALSPSISILPPPTVSQTAPTLAPLTGLPLMLIAMVSGALGGMLSGFVSLYLSSEVVPETQWYDRRPALMTAKTVIGAVSAFIGLELVAVGFLTVDYRTNYSVVVLSVLFGFGQLVLTTFLDKQAKASIRK